MNMHEVMYCLAGIRGVFRERACRSCRSCVKRLSGEESRARGILEVTKVVGWRCVQES